MLNRIIRFSLDNRLAVIVITGLLMMYGMVVLLRTEVDIFPDLNAPTVTVMTEAPGMAAEEIEATITYPIETAVNGAAGVRRVRSSSASGFSTVWVEFDWDTDVYQARQIVTEKLAQINGSFPPGAGVPTLGPQSSILGEIMIIGLTADSITSQMDLRTLADREFAPQLLAIPGVASVSVIGGEPKQYQILLCPAKMQSLGVTLDDVRSAATNLNNNAAAGVIYDYGNEYIVKADINTADISEMANTVVKCDNGSIIRFSDIAQIREGIEEPRLGAASVNGHSAVIITVTKQPGVGTPELTNRIDAKVAQIAESLPADIVINTDIFRQNDFISRSIGNLREALFIGALFVVIILFLFLTNVRTTLISLTALPLSIILTVIAMHFMGLTINTMSLGGIAIAIGSLVDDAIVDVENVYKRLRQNLSLGRPVLQVVFEASKEVRLPIFNSSLIIIASFLPLFFLSGIEGRMLIPLGISFVVALIASTIVALTVTPVLCSFLPVNTKLAKESRVAVALANQYRRALEWALAHYKGILAAVALLFIISVGLIFTLGRSFLPPFNEGSLTINISTLPGISLENSDRVGLEAERIIMSIPEIQTVARKTGRAELDEHALGVNVSEIEAPYILNNGRTRQQMVADLRSKLKHLPGVNIEIGQPISHRIDAMLSGTEAQVAIKLFGDDLNTLLSIGRRIQAAAAEVPGVEDLNIEQQMERPELVIRPRRDMLAYYGISMSDFADFVRIAISGETVSQVYENGRPFDLVLKMEPSATHSIDQVADLIIDSSRGKIPLSAVAEIRSDAAPNTINRENVSRRIVISANVEGRDLRSVVNDIKDEIEEDIILPEGYYITYGGQFESEESATRTLLLVSLLAITLIFLLLYGQYKSSRKAAIIMLNMPLALIGGVIIIRLTSGQLNIPAIIGFISLMGIATRNGMLLMSRYESLRQSGENLSMRIIHGSVDRLNPILMTALSSALALIPLAINGTQPGNEIQSPLAIVILGGLLSSTLLNIFVVPIIYNISNSRNPQ